MWQAVFIADVLFKLIQAVLIADILFTEYSFIQVVLIAVILLTKLRAEFMAEHTAILAINR